MPNMVLGLTYSRCIYAVAILAGKFHTLSTPAFIVCFAFLQFFFNFGANTYVLLMSVFLVSID